LGRFLPIVKTECTKQSGQVSHCEISGWEDTMSNLVEGKQGVSCEEVRREPCGLLYGEECCLDFLVTSPLVSGILVFGEMLTCDTVVMIEPHCV
jgi:hypothetical protein